jgi:hypothetical protein
MPPEQRIFGARCLDNGSSGQRDGRRKLTTCAASTSLTIFVASERAGMGGTGESNVENRTQESEGEEKRNLMPSSFAGLTLAPRLMKNPTVRGIR